ADPPKLSVSPAAGDQDTSIPLSIAAALTDTDGSETLSIDVAGLPPGARLSAGTVVELGHYRLSPGQLAGLSVIPAAGSAQAFTLTVTATSRELANGDQAHVSAPPDV